MARRVTIYGRDGLAFVAPDDQTVDGLWIATGNLHVAGLDDATLIGDAVIAALRRSRVGVPHPRRDEWAEQRNRSLSPLVDTAGVRTWRSFVRRAELATVTKERSGLTVHAWSRDERRHDVFLPDDERSIRSVEITPTAIGRAVQQVLRSDV